MSALSAAGAGREVAAQIARTSIRAHGIRIARSQHARNTHATTKSPRGDRDSTPADAGALPRAKRRGLVVLASSRAQHPCTMTAYRTALHIAPYLPARPLRPAASWADWRGRAVRPLRQPWGTDARAAVTVMPLPLVAPMHARRAKAIEAPLPHAIEPARRIVLFATFPDGTPVPRGTPVLDAHRTQVAVVAEAGQVFLTHDIVDAQLGVPLPGGGIGLLAFTIPAQPAPGVHYERIPAMCRPLRRQRSAWTIGAHAAGH
jgi:hypothetical protein